MNGRILPLDLRIVAWLFLIVGLDSAYKYTLATLHHGGIPQDFDGGLVCIPCYFGLVRQWPGWRGCSLALIAIYSCVALFVVIYVYTHDQGASFDLFGHRFIKFPNRFASIYFGAYFALAIWEWKVLTRPDIAALFRRQDRASHA
jgi:hypothetical protein